MQKGRDGIADACRAKRAGGKEEMDKLLGGGWGELCMVYGKEGAGILQGTRDKG